MVGKDKKKKRKGKVIKRKKIRRGLQNERSTRDGKVSL